VSNISESYLGIDFFNANPKKFCFIPLGGANEIGMNFNLYFHNGKFLLIDCGIGFAGGEINGVDVVLPNIDFLVKNKIKLSGIVITHIHEDHIGAIPYMWDRLRCRIYATKLAAEFLREKISDCYFKKEVEVKIIDSSKPVSIDGFHMDLVGITHSVPEMQGIFIDSPYGKIFHTGDWKIDKHPVAGEETDFKKIKELSKNGVYAMVCDSTNVFNDGYSGSEGDLEKEFIKLVKDYQDGCVFITTFASNIARLHTISNVAKKTGRKLFISGRSIERIVKVAKKSGYLDECVEFLDQRDFSSVPRYNAIVICTGCQGEELASLTKIASGQSKYVNIKKGDVVLFSSKVIPGNDKKIFSIYNMLALLNIDVITEKTNKIHVSGHPNREELRKMYSVVKPEYAIPVHGEPAHLREHCLFAKQIGIKNTCRVKNGDVFEFGEKGIKKIGVVKNGYDVVDGTIVRSKESIVLKERDVVAKSGIFICVLRELKKDIDIEILSDGFLNPKEDKGIFYTLKQNVIDLIHDLVKAGALHDKAHFCDSLQKSIAKLCLRKTGKAPLVKILF
jgi:ribonuclease J